MHRSATVLALATTALLPRPVVAAGINLMWDPSPDPAAVGYVVYSGPVGTAQPSRIEVGNVTSALITNLQQGLTYLFYVTAYDSARNESDPSNVINYTVPSSTTPPILALHRVSPSTFTLSFTNLTGYDYLVQTNADLGSTNWGTLSSVSASNSSGVISLPQCTSNAPRLFYRVSMPLH